MEVNEDALALDLDVFIAAHGRAKPYVLKRRTSVSNEAMEISLIPTLGETTISGIEILPAPASPLSILQFTEMTESEAGPLIQRCEIESRTGWDPQ